MGMADEHDKESSAVSGLLCDSVDPYGADTFGIEEMGLLDSVAFCECCQSDSLPEGWSGVHACCKLPVSGERYMVAVHMV